MNFADPASWLHRLTLATFSIATVVTQQPFAAADEVKPLKQAHAHNDYLHERPLLDALDQGFGSVEADVFLVDGELLVAHARTELSKKRSLRALYLDPLKQRIVSHGGSVYGDGQAFTLLIDIKADGLETFQALNRLLAEYPEIFACVENNKQIPGPVLAIVSGDRAVEQMLATSPRYVGIDGRLSDLGSQLPQHALPLISDNWTLNFTWRGMGDFPNAERKKLADIVKRAHSMQRRVRFWATPDKPELWRALRDAGVDLINTDDLPGLGQFLREAAL